MTEPTQPTPAVEAAPTEHATVTSPAAAPEVSEPVPSDACKHEWELKYRNPRAGRLVHDCGECGMRRYTDKDGSQTTGAHAPWAAPAHVASLEKSLTEPRRETPEEMHRRLFRAALTARA